MSSTSSNSTQPLPLCPLPEGSPQPPSSDTMTSATPTPLVGTISTPSGDDSSTGSAINFSLPLDRKLAGLLDTGYLTDVEFLVGPPPTTPIPAHKLILAMGSPVFLRQFFGTLPSESVIPIPDIDPDSFRLLLQYIYGAGGGVFFGEGGGSGSEGIEAKILPLLYAAHKYDVRGLQELCALKLSLALNSWNVLSILHTAELYNLPELGAKCWKMIQANTRSVLNFHQHSIDAPTLLRIVKDDALSIDEVKLFEFLNSWAENECERDEIVPSADNKLRRLGDILRYIRFPTMTSGDFANRVAPKGLLSEEQVAKVLTYICSNPENRLFLRVDFPTTRRRDQEEAFLFQNSVVSHHASGFLRDLTGALAIIPGPSGLGTGSGSSTSTQPHPHRYGSDSIIRFGGGGPHPNETPSSSLNPHHHHHHGLVQGPGGTLFHHHHVGGAGSGGVPSGFGFIQNPHRPVSSQWLDLGEPFHSSSSQSMSPPTRAPPSASGSVSSTSQQPQGQNGLRFCRLGRGTGGARRLR